ncbi:lytic transglycosylase domain-containing protein [Sporosarcina sp. GW1-11]|uniref:lytic transglycosylase domain-containing protein n=1 Tax=Sporosarcina sp. GW1-11 TaxID=2899126 RepID=UPI002954A04F|nr:lytic transglycosylase domain-containing protein [Sporosarcina sp. GW1-11]
MSLPPLNMRLLLELNTLQTLGAVQSFGTRSSGDSNEFQLLLSQLMTESTMGRVQTPSLANDSLLYQGEAYTPSILPAISLPIPLPETSTTGKGQYGDIIKEAATTYQLPEKLISAVIKQESNFNTHATSSAGAGGLMQLMPGTAKFLGVTDRFDPKQNIMGGAKYLRSMLNQFGSIETALAAYNAGPGNVKKYGGIPPFKETQNYVKKVMHYYGQKV